MCWNGCRFFFFQAEDGIRDLTVTGVQTCALPILPPGSTHGDEAAIDVGPQRQARAATNGLELPPHIEASPVVLKRVGSVGSPHFGFGNVPRWPDLVCTARDRSPASHYLPFRWC